MRHAKASSREAETLMKEFLSKMTEASYQVALKTGFRGSFMAFLSDLQEALDQVIQKDRELARRLERLPAAQRQVH